MAEGGHRMSTWRSSIAHFNQSSSRSPAKLRVNNSCPSKKAVQIYCDNKAHLTIVSKSSRCWCVVMRYGSLFHEKYLAVSLLQNLQQQCMGASPMLLISSRFAPASRSMRLISTKPSVTARCSGVFPHVSSAVATSRKALSRRNRDLTYITRMKYE